MRKVWVVAVREYLAAVQTKAFVISLVIMPVLMVGSIVAQMVLEKHVDVTDKRFAVIDHTGQLANHMLDAADARNQQQIFQPGDTEDRKQILPRFLLEVVDPVADDAQVQRLELSDRVRSKDLYGFVEIGADALEPGDHRQDTSIRYYSNTPTYGDFRRWFAASVNNEITGIRIERAGLDPEIVREMTATVGVESLGLWSLDEEGQITEGEKIDKMASFLMPVIMVMLLFMVIAIGATPLINSVLEEKMQRIAEVLLGSISPFKLMLGKLLGTVGVSLTIMAVYLAGAMVAAQKTGFTHLIPTHLLVWLVVYQALAVLMYGSMFIAVGAACSDLKEAQSYLLPVWLLICTPLFVLGPVLKEPSSTFATTISLIPTATPILMLLRQAIPPGVPAWQPAVGVVSVIITTILFVVIAGRIFRVGILMQGKPPNVRELVRWVLRG